MFFSLSPSSKNGSLATRQFEVGNNLFTELSVCCRPNGRGIANDDLDLISPTHWRSPTAPFPFYLTFDYITFHYNITVCVLTCAIEFSLLSWHSVIVHFHVVHYRPTVTAVYS